MRKLLFVPLAACALAACVATSTVTDGKEGDGEADVGPRLEQIYSELQGLSLSERREALIEMATKETGEAGVADLYGSMNLDEATPIVDAFEDETGLEVDVYRASSSSVLQRLLQEADAGFAGADVVYTNGPEISVLDDEGLLTRFESPTTKDIPDVGGSENWSPIYLNLFTAAWNTGNVSASERPTTWEDVLTKFKGRLAMELGDFDWFQTLTTEYFIEQKGMSESEAIALFEEAASGARAVDGHTLMAELVAAGEFDVATSTYRHRIGQLKDDGAPVDWEPAVEPLVVRPNGIAIMKSSTHPATALLFSEFMLTDVQKMLIDFDRTPASTAVEGGGIPTEYDVIVTDLDALFRERDKWEGLYEDIIQRTGDVVED